MMDTMIQACSLFLAMFVLTALIELFALRRWSNRWGMLGCIVGVGAFCGMVWLAGWMMIDWGDEATTEGPPPFMIKLAVLLVLFLGFTMMAMIPAGLTGLIYRKAGRRLPN